MPEGGSGTSGTSGKTPQKTIAAPAPAPRVGNISSPATVATTASANLGIAETLADFDGTGLIPQPTAGPSPSRTVLAKKPTPTPAKTDAVASAPVAPVAPLDAASSVHCPACSTTNPAGMNFCKMCGTTLRTSAAPRSALPSPLAAVVSKPPLSKLPVSPAASASSTLRTCPTCGGHTPGAFAFCQHCGAKVGILTTAEVAVADTLAATGAEEIVPLVKKRSSDPGAETPALAKPSYVELSLEPGADEEQHADASTDLSAPVIYGKLVTVLRDGSDGESHALSDDLVDIGRSEGQLLFTDDAFLAARHVRLERRAGAVVLLPLDTTNGVYVRVRQGETVPLRHGDQLLIGKEVLRFEVLEPEERAQLPAIQHGVRLFGSPMRAPWARLMQMVQLGVARDVYHLVPNEVVLGREDGDIRFPDDEFMSRRHARIAHRDGKFELADEGSSNGTYIRLRGERALRAGDRLRLGDQLFRYESID